MIWVTFCFLHTKSQILIDRLSTWYSIEVCLPFVYMFSPSYLHSLVVFLVPRRQQPPRPYLQSLYNLRLLRDYLKFEHYHNPLIIRIEVHNHMPRVSQRVEYHYHAKCAPCEPAQMGSQVLGPNSFEFNPCNLGYWEYESWDLSLHMGYQVLNPKYDTNAYMATSIWRQGLRLVLSIESSIKPDPTLNTSYKTFFHRTIKIQNW